MARIAQGGGRMSADALSNELEAAADESNAFAARFFALFDATGRAVLERRGNT